MAINRNNYGAYFLDYWESNLDVQAKSALASFLKANPDLQDAFFDFKEAINASIPEEDKITYPNKNGLKKIEVQSIGEINQMNWEFYVIAYIEGDLPTEKSSMFQEFVTMNPQLNKEIRLYRKAHLIPDRATVFEDKSALKKRILPFQFSGIALRHWISVAAVILVAFILYQSNDFLSTSTDSVTQVSENEYYINHSAPVSEKADYDQSMKSSLTEIIDSVKPNENTIVSPNPVSFDNQYDKNRDVAMDLHPVSNRDGIMMTKLDTRFEQRLIDSESSRNKVIETRNEFSEIFDYLMIRDGLVLEETADKSLAGRVLAGIKRTFSRDEIQPVQGILSPVLTGVAENGREVLSRSAQIFPVLNKVDEDGRKETSFALGETLNFRLSRVKSTSE